MEPSSSTVFVGQVPRDMAEQDLRTFMEECGRIVHVNMLTDRGTGQFKGCAFVTFETTEGAELAKETMHDKQRLPGASHPMQVTTARSKSGPGGGGHHSGGGGGHGHSGMSGDTRSSSHQPRRKLFVGMLSRNLSDEDLRQMFLPFGDVEDCIILRTTDKSSKGCAFVTMADMQCCQKAIVALHNSQTFPGCSGPIVVKFADTQEQKENRRGRDMPQGGIMGMPPHLHMPPGPHMPPHQAMAGGVAPGYGHHQLPPPSMPAAAPTPDMSGLQNLLAPTMAQLVKQQQELQQQQRTINQALQMLGIPAAGGRTEQYSLPGVADPSGYVLPTPPGPATAATGAVGAMPPYEQPPAPQVPGATGPGGYRTGPEGSNLFIYHLSSGVADNDLHQLFSAYGQVVSARVYCDRATGQSKGFGFVSYDNPQSAQAAIQALHGYQMGGRRLKVQLKKGRETARPY